MGGFSDIQGWDDLEATTRQIATAQGLTNEEREELVTKMHAAIARAAAQGQATSTVMAFKDLLTGVASSGGLRALLAL